MSIPNNTRDNEQNKFVESRTRPNKPAVDVNIGGKSVNSDEETITLVDTTDSTLIYIGSALPGTLSSDAAWRIQRVDLTTSEIKILFADSDQEYDNVWDQRVSLVYG